MKVLLLGFSSIARRRVLPALQALGVARVDIASVSAPEQVAQPQCLGGGGVFKSYEEALRQSAAELVYISTVNSLHAELAQTALLQGRHVVIDKPAATSLSDTKRLVTLARESGNLIAEATVWGFHPQIRSAQSFFEEQGVLPSRLLSAFCFPSLPAGNFRHRPELGGGVLLDLGMYAVSAGRHFFGSAPLEIEGRSNPGDTAFTMLGVYPGDRTAAGIFATGTAYVNSLTMLGPGVSVTMERAFTSSQDAVCKLQVQGHNDSRQIVCEPADSFALFLSAVLDGIASGETSRFGDAMLADAEALERLRLSCQVVPVSCL